MSPAIRPAHPAEAADVIALLDRALLEFSRDAVRARAGTDDVLVATDGDRLLGAILLDDNHIEAVAVRPHTRRQGIGSTLVDRAAQERGRVTAEFEARNRPFYEALGFRVMTRNDGRLRGERTA